MYQWFNGKMLACHAGAPGSIPGWCIAFFLRSDPPPQKKFVHNFFFFAGSYRLKLSAIIRVPGLGYEKIAAS